MKINLILSGKYCEDQAMVTNFFIRYLKESMKTWICSLVLRI